MNIPSFKFKIGRLVITPGALAAITDSDENPWHFVVRHMAGTWGEVDLEDKQLNDQAVEDGSRILSAYKTAQGRKIWVITEADRSGTTILLPEEY